MNRSRIPLPSAALGDSTPKVLFPLLGGAYVYGEDNPLLRIYAVLWLSYRRHHRNT